MDEFDVIVVGSGLVGAALALALAQDRLRVALVEQAEPPALPDDDSWDARIYAITPGNADFLRKLDVWDALDVSRIAPIHSMAVWGDDHRTSLEFDPYEVGRAELGYIVESRLLQDELWRKAGLEPNIERICPARCESLHLGEDHAGLQLEGSRELQARLIVGADGSGSWVRQQAGIDVSALSYRQSGIVANFETEKPHGNIARQWFLQNGILAWLPLPGKRISIVWSAFDDEVEALLKLNEQAFCEAVAAAGQYALGTLRLITPAAAFPLRLQHNAAIIDKRLALVGDAAHQVHPLAGQGVNLGFRDVQILSEVLQGRGRRDLGDHLLLRRYERARKADILTMQAVTTGLQKLFNNDHTWLGWLRNTGLGLVNHTQPLKRQLMAQAIH